MAARKPARGPARPAAKAGRGQPSVSEFLRDLDHPRKRDIAAVRRWILAVSPEIREEVKWNAPSFCTTEFFATVNLRARDTVQLVLHRGAKVKDDSTTGMRIEDPAGLLTWLARDRCLATIGRGKAIEERGPALQAILRAWIRHL